MACTSSNPTRAVWRAATPARVVWPHRSGSLPRSNECSAAARLAGAHVVVTAGGTREPIDAVRVIANRSSGKQGYAIAAEALAMGARVTLVSTVALADTARCRVAFGRDCRRHAARRRGLSQSADVVVMAAAVADFRPKVAEAGKIKKDGGVPEIVLEPTPDILAGARRAQAARPTAGRLRRRDQPMSSPTPRRSCVARTSTSSSPTTSAHRMSASNTTPTRSRCCAGTAPRPPCSLTDKRSVARAILECVVELRSGVSSSDPNPVTNDNPTIQEQHQ